MIPRADVPANLRKLADLQAGVVTSEQVAGHGLTKSVVARLIDSGWWQRLARGVYLTIPGTPDWASLAWAGVLLGGDDSRLGPRASGFLHGLLPLQPDPSTCWCRMAGPSGFPAPGTSFANDRLPARWVRWVFHLGWASPRPWWISPGRGAKVRS